MAVEDKYTDADIAAGDKAVPGRGAQEIIQLIGLVAVVAADDDGSKYRVFKALPSSFRPTEIIVQTTAITNGTDYELGVYEVGVGGAVVSKGLFMTGQTLASASRSLDGLANVTLPNLGACKTIAELLGLTPTTAKAAYDVVLTGDTVGTVDGTVRIIMRGYAG